MTKSQTRVVFRLESENSPVVNMGNCVKLETDNEADHIAAAGSLWPGFGAGVHDWLGPKMT
ncbi:hypothetical protein [Spirillospora sp. CA-294931]|uniref:hypothetical protein n=1 Tax=Spirillospora sp. CA-294931 TaxID=3240042 RepID=UPI003D8AA67F